MLFFATFLGKFLDNFLVPVPISEEEGVEHTETHGYSTNDPQRDKVQD
jgi:hypothetical protein